MTARVLGKRCRGRRMGRRFGVLHALLAATLWLFGAADVAHATGGKIETPAPGATVAQPVVISGWAVGFKCTDNPPQPTQICRWDNSWRPPGHSGAIAQATFPGCPGNPTQPNWICLWPGS
jgi:hypothetical protein